MTFVVIELTTQHAEDVFALQEVGLASSWTLDNIKNTLKNQHNFSLGVTRDGVLVSFCLSTIVIDELNILHLVTHKDHRRFGLGKFLLSELIKQAKSKGVISSFLEVRESNLPAIGLYKSLGYSEIDTRKDYYQNPTESAVVMKLSI